MSPQVDLSVECVGQKWLLVLCGMMLLLSVPLTKRSRTAGGGQRWIHSWRSLGESQCLFQV